MAGLSFIQIGFLAAGLAVVVPIAIHLLFRQKTRVVPIGSIRFLQSVVREHRRRRRIRQWILLALRTLAVALLAALFARPYFDTSARDALLSETIVLVDASASMGTRDAGGETSWERAVARVRELIGETNPNIVFHLAVCDATGVRELPLQDWETTARPGVAATDFGLALAWARVVLAVSQRTRQRVVLVSDLQRSGLPQAARELLPAGVEFETRDVGAPLAFNLAISEVSAPRTEIRANSPIVVRATARNYGPLPARGVQFQATCEGPDGPRTVTRQLDIPGRASARVEFPFDISQDGIYRGSVKMESSDSLAVDDQRWFALEARRPDRILLVDGQEGRSVFANETYFLETALKLRPAEGSPGQRAFEVERIVWENGRGFPRLEGYRAVALANVRRLTNDDAQRLRAYLDAGGGVIVFAGSQVSQETLAPLAAAGISPGELASAPRDQRLRVTAWATKHPALASLSDPQRGDLRRLEVQQSLPIERVAANATPLLEMGPLALAVEVQVGRGRFIYFGTSADRDWTDWPRTRLYVPVVRQLLDYLSNPAGERSPIVDRLAERWDESLGAQESEGRVTVVNFDPRESSLDRVETDELRDALGLGAGAPGSQARSAGLQVDPPANAIRANEIWTWLAWFVLAVLAAETLLASRVHA